MAKRPPEDIDPTREDVAQAPRKRRHRAKPAPSPQLQAGKPAALSRALKRPLSPGIMFEAEGDHYVSTSPHSDLDLWELQIADAFGTRSQSVIKAFVKSLKALGSQAWDEPNGRWKPSEFELNAAMAMVADVRPRNTAEAALAAQMVAVHLMTMRLSAQALNRGHMVMERDAALAGKLARTYAMQLDTLQRMRGRKTARQSIKVSKELHQHVHYHHHRGDEESNGQPQAADADKPGDCRALPSPDSGGQVVPITSRGRKAGV